MLQQFGEQEMRLCVAAAAAAGRIQDEHRERQRHCTETRQGPSASPGDAGCNMVTWSTGVLMADV